MIQGRTTLHTTITNNLTLPTNPSHASHANIVYLPNLHSTLGSPLLPSTLARGEPAGVGLLSSWYSQSAVVLNNNRSASTLLEKAVMPTIRAQCTTGNSGAVLHRVLS